MPKTINIQDIKIREFSISKVNDEWTISIVYALLDDAEKEWNQKRIDIKDLNATQKTSIQKVKTFLISKIKQIEGV